MTTSGTWNFSPSLGEIGLTAFGRTGVRRTELTQSHMQDLRNAANFLLAEWSNQTPNLWEVGLVSQTLVEGQATYTVNPNTVMILDAYIDFGSPATSRVIIPISRTEYASYPNKTQEGFPTVFWFDRLLAPTITLWMVPDGNGPYTLNYYSVIQVQDSNLANGQQVDIPYRFLDAFTAGLAWKLAEIYAPGMEDKLFARYTRAWDIAARQDTENVNMIIGPGLGAYYRD